MTWRTIAALLVLQLCWMLACEAWQDPWRSPGGFALFVLLAWPLLVAAWRDWLPRKLGGLVVAAVFLLVIDLSVDAWFPPPYPIRFIHPWSEAARLLVFLAAAAAARRLPAAPPPALRHALRALRVVSLLPPAAFAALLVYVIAASGRDDPARADAALVLGYALDPAGQPRPPMIGRVDRAAALYRAGAAPLLIVSGGVARNGRSEAAVMQELLIARGVPREAILIEDRSGKTRENFACTAVVLSRLHAGRVLLVTDAWHMPRALFEGGHYWDDLHPAPSLSMVHSDLRHATYWLWYETVTFMVEATRPLYAPLAVCPPLGPATPP